MIFRTMLTLVLAALAAACTDAPDRLVAFSPSTLEPRFALGFPNSAAADALVVGETLDQATILARAASPPPPPPTDTTTPPPPPPSSGVVIAPALPQTSVNTTPVTVTGATITVPAGGDFQAALNSAQPGDAIVLAAGATYSGNFVLPLKSGTGWITIRGSASASSLPAPGRRMTPAYASVLPKLVTPNGIAALSTAQGAHHYRIVGIEVTAASSVTAMNTLVALGTAGSAQSTLSQVPRDLVLEQVYVHGNATLSFSRCVTLNSAWTAVIDSHVSECHSSTNDSQGIVGWNGPGPFKIVNNFIEGAAENLLFGGADPSIPNLVPSDIEVRRNHFYKPLAWQGSRWIVKNSFELKNARRVLVEGNVFENNWQAAQNGFALVLKSVNQEGTCSWCTTSDVTFQYNVVRRVAAAFNVAGKPEVHPAIRAARFRIAHNVFEQVGDPSLLNGGAPGRLLQLIEALDVEYAHNTGVGTSNGLLFVGPPTGNGFVLRDNVIGGGPVIASGEGRVYGTSALDYHAPGWQVRGNVMLGAPTGTSAFPTGNVYATSASVVGLAPDLRVIAAPALGSATTDGLPPGADRVLVDQKTAGVVVP